MSRNQVKVEFQEFNLLLLYYRRDQNSMPDWQGQIGEFGVEQKTLLLPFLRLLGNLFTC